MTQLLSFVADDPYFGIAAYSGIMRMLQLSVYYNTIIFHSIL